MSYEKIGALNNGPDNSPPATPPANGRRRRLAIFFVGWTVFAALAVWWLAQHDGQVQQEWFVAGDDSANPSLGQRLRDWLKLADLSFHGIYPCLLLAPYVAWLAARFRLERGRWQTGLPTHLAGCAIFAAACHAVATSSSGRHFVVFAGTTEITDGKETKTFQTNGMTIVTNAGWAQFPGPWGGGGAVRIGKSVGPGQIAGAAGWEIPGNPPIRKSVFWRQHFWDILPDLLNIFAYAGLVGLVHSVHFYRRSLERERRAATLEAQLSQARLNALQAQLHPHFLFNALNAISTLLRRDTRAAQDALASFSELLRMALSHSNQPEVTLREDLEFLRRYVEIQQTRLGERLRFEEEIAPEALDCLVPALLLQPLVENAIRHGIEPSANPGLVRVIAQAQGDILIVRVEDNGAGLSSKEDERNSGVGIGLQNLRARLETLYAARHKLKFGSRPEGGVSVALEIPLRQARAAEPAVSAP